ncbi:MAG: hypothetical protein D6680_09410 [Cyanobacteria bacterium J007]|nr:MAG: hypothetical protein D6680_09410 [Cyanobacteria bacterium J007]
MQAVGTLDFRDVLKMFSLLTWKPIQRGLVASIAFVAPLTVAGDLKFFKLNHSRESVFELLTHAHGELENHNRKREKKQGKAVPFFPEGGFWA